MEQYFWHILWTYAFGLFIIGTLFRSYVKNITKELKDQKADYENKITALSVNFRSDLVKLRFELNNKPKYTVGDKLLNDYYIVLWFGIGDLREEGHSGYITNCFYNKYEVFIAEKKTKVFISEKNLEELIKKATV